MKTEREQFDDLLDLLERTRVTRADRAVEDVVRARIGRGVRGQRERFELAAEAVSTVVLRRPR